jgi:hypothetical protein
VRLYRCQIGTCQAGIPNLGVCEVTVDTTAMQAARSAALDRLQNARRGAPRGKREWHFRDGTRTKGLWGFGGIVVFAEPHITGATSKCSFQLEF